MGKPSLVLELQQLALAPETSIAELLRRAKAVAVKLDRDDARSWIDLETNGYPSTQEVPEYRVVPSELQVQNPFHGWHPVAWGDANPLQEHFAQAHIREPISKVEDLTRGEGRLQASLTQPEADALRATGNTRFDRLPAARVLSKAGFVGILEAVRTKVLDWALALEKEGVLGEGMTFNNAEKRDAGKVAFRATKIRAVVLFLSANPDPKSPLNVEKEQNRIVKVRNGSKHQEAIRIEGLPDVDLPEFAKSLRLHSPAVLHFSGHGGKDGSLFMRDHDDKPYEMKPKGLAKLLAVHKNHTRLVVLNACYSKELAGLLNADIDCVVGMTTAVSDDAAILFTQTFYGGLFDGESVQSSFDVGSAAVQARYPAEANTPILLSKTGADPTQVHLDLE